MTATVRSLLAEAAARLSGDERGREAELLLQHALQQPRAWLFAHAEDAVDSGAAALFRMLVGRRAEGEPLAYITGRREFWSLDIEVTPDVLIPRAETELLVELALQRIPPNAETEVVDLGTGSGAVALALARERPLARIIATDASVAALAVARSNARRLDLQRVEFVHGDWFAPLAQRRFDVIVSNPPYIAESDAHLGRGDLPFEPPAALASGSEGLDAIHAIVSAAPLHMKDAGWLLFEHGFDQARAARSLLERAGFVEVFTALDLEQRERVSGGRVVRRGPSARE